MRKLLLYSIISLVTSTGIIGQRTDREVIENAARAEKLKSEQQKNTERSSANTNRINSLKQKAAEGDRAAMFDYGNYLMLQSISHKDSLVAFEWINRSAAQNYAPAYERIGRLYKYGRLVPYDLSTAFQYFDKAAVTDFPPGLYSRGFMYYKGLGCEQDYRKAFADFNKGALAGDERCMYMLALCYRNGFGVEPDESAAQTWLQKSSNTGFLPAQREAAIVLPENNDEAMKLIASGKDSKVYSRELPIIAYAFNRITDVTKEVTDQTFNGYLMKSDWSGSNLIEARKVMLTCSVSGNVVTGILLFPDEGQQYELSGRLADDHSIEFENVILKRNDRYIVAPHDALQVTGMRIGFSYTNDDRCILKSRISARSTYEMEPERPLDLILIRSYENADGRIKSNPETSLFPNPASGPFTVAINIATESECRITVTSASGKKIYESETSVLQPGSYAFPLSLELLPGTYIVTTNIDNHISNHKLIRL